MVFYISGPKLLFETTEISTHPNSTQQESNYIYLYTTKFGTSIKIRLNRKFESTEFETMRVNCISIILSPNLRLDLNQIWAQIMLCLLFIVEKAVFQLHWATCLFNVCCMFQYDALPVLQFGRPQYISHRQEVTSQSNTILPAIKKKYMAITPLVKPTLYHTGWKQANHYTFGQTQNLPHWMQAR